MNGPYRKRVCTPIYWPILSACIMTPFFSQILHSMTPLSLQSTPNDPLFKNFIVKFQIFYVHFKIFANFQLKRVNLHSNLTKVTPNDASFWEVHTKNGPIFFESHTQWPPFCYEILHRMPPVSFSGRHIPPGVLNFELGTEVRPDVSTTTL